MPGWINSRLAVLLAALVLPMLALGCGDDDDEGGGGDEAAAKPKAVAIETSAEGGKYRIQAPRKVEAGVAEITFTNSDPKNEHEAQLIKVTGDAAPEAVVRALAGAGEGKPIPSFIRGGGGVSTTAPGETRTVTQALELGRYVVVDTESEGDEAPPFATQGAVAEIEVTGSAPETALPDAPATVTARDYSFEASGLKAGANQVQFENTGRQPHHVVAIPLKPDATIEDARRSFQEEDEGDEADSPFAGDEGDGTAVLDAGQSQVATLDLKPGKYVLACFISDREGGPPHVAQGMVAEATVR